jgi:hypothetical protein
MKHLAVKMDEIKQDLRSICDNIKCIKAKQEIKEKDKKQEKKSG